MTEIESLTQIQLIKIVIHFFTATVKYDEMTFMIIGLES